MQLFHRIRNIKQRSLIEYIICLGFAILTYFFFTLTVNVEEESFVVPLTIETDDEFVATNTIPRTIQVIVRGNPASLNRIVADNISAQVDFGSISGEGEFSAPVVLERLGILTQLQNVELIGSVTQISAQFEKKVAKDLNVKPAFINSLQRGYTLEQSYIIPRKVRVVGPRSLLEPLTTINTNDIDLSNITQNTSITVPVRPPDPLIDFVDRDSVRVSIAVEQSTVVKSFNNVKITTEGLREGFTVNFDNANAVVILQGPAVELENYRPSASIDLSRYQLPGIYSVAINVKQLPADTEIVSIEPQNISVAIQRANTNSRNSEDIDSSAASQSSPQVIESESQTIENDIPTDNEATQDDSNKLNLENINLPSDKDANDN